MIKNPPSGTGATGEIEHDPFHGVLRAQTSLGKSAMSVATDFLTLPASLHSTVASLVRDKCRYN